MALFLCKFTTACLKALQLKKLDFKWQLFFSFRVNCYKPTFILCISTRDGSSPKYFKNIWLFKDNQNRWNFYKDFKNGISKRVYFPYFGWHKSCTKNDGVRGHQLSKMVLSNGLWKDSNQSHYGLKICSFIHFELKIEAFLDH